MTFDFLLQDIQLLLFIICLFFYHINAQVLDEAREGRVPWVRGVNLHILKADGLGILHTEHLFVLNDELELDLPVLHLLGHAELGPFFDRWRRKVHGEVCLSIVSAGKVEAEAWIEKECGGPFADFSVGEAASSDCHVEDVGPAWVVQVGRLQHELHHPLAWQGR